MTRTFVVRLCACLLTCLAAPAAWADSDAQKLETVKQMVEAWNTRNWERVYDLFAPDGVLQSMMLSQPTVGREAIRKRIGALATDISRIELKIRHMGVADGVVFIERVDDFVYRGNHGAVPVVGVVEVANGKVKVWREYYDRAQMIEAMGLKEDFDDAHKSE